jgi:hypothetical protein
MGFDRHFKGEGYGGKHGRRVPTKPVGACINVQERCRSGDIIDGLMLRRQKFKQNHYMWMSCRYFDHIERTRRQRVREGARGPAPSEKPAGAQSKNEVEKKRGDRLPGAASNQEVEE